MRFDMLLKLVKKEFKDIAKNASILPILLIAPFLSLIMTKLEQAPKEYMLPIWIVYGLAMVGTMLPGFLTAEEKEKKTLDSLLVSPLSHNEVIVGKVIFTMVMICLVTILVLAPNGGFMGNQLWVWLAVILGGAFFIQVGLIIGLFTDSQVTAGAFLSPVMLFFVLTPMFMAVVPPFLRTMMEYLPSIAILEISGAGFLAKGFNEIWRELLILLGWNLVAFYITKLGIKRQFD